MKGKLAWSVAVVALMFAPRMSSDAAPRAEEKKATAREKMATVDYLVGTWSCEHTVGTFAGKYKTTYAKVLGDLWLKQTYDFPPQQTAERTEPPVTAETLMGYDERRQAWVRFFANSEGQYFAIRMSDTGNGWSFKYVSFFKTVKPETTDADATFTKKSGTEYSIDGPTYPENGVEVTEHHSCHKL